MLDEYVVTHVYALILSRLTEQDLSHPNVVIALSRTQPFVMCFILSHELSLQLLY